MFNDIDRTEGEIEDYKNDFKELKKQIETAAKELGVDAKSIKEYNNLDGQFEILSDLIPDLKSYKKQINPYLKLR